MIALFSLSTTVEPLRANIEWKSPLLKLGGPFRPKISGRRGRPPPTILCVRKRVLYGQLYHGFRRPGGQYKRYKDCLKTTLNECDITPSELETLARNRNDWWSMCKSAVEEFEVRRIQELESKRNLRKSGPPSTSNFECQICHRMCRSWIMLLAQNKSHLWWWDALHRRLSAYFWARWSMVTQVL